METKKLILFGCGNLGYEALHFLGEKNVECFCDNHTNVVAKGGAGKKNIISFETLVQKYKDQIVVLCVVDDRDICNMAKQCEESGVYDYLAYTTVKEKANSREASLAYIMNPQNRMSAKKEFWQYRMTMLEKQVEYFRNHADIRHMKAAEGELRVWQTKCVHAAAELVKKIEKLGINPFLIGGNLIGYVRHNGFTPWDDDIDLGLIRSEYEKLRNYCRENLYTFEEYMDKDKTTRSGNGIAEGMEDFCWVCYPSNFVVFYRGISIDFFALDYYAHEISFDDMKADADEIRKKLKTLESIEAKNQYLESVKELNCLKTVEKSNCIYFGIDNVEMEHKYHKGSFIPENVIFPLRKVVWEGEHFFVPNNAEGFLDYEFGNIWEFPKDVGIPKHFKTLGIDEGSSEI